MKFNKDRNKADQPGMIDYTLLADKNLSCLPVASLRWLLVFDAQNLHVGATSPLHL